MNLIYRMLSDAPLTLPAAKYRPTLTKTEKSNRTNQVCWKLEGRIERIAPLTRSSPCEVSWKVEGRMNESPVDPKLPM